MNKVYIVFREIEYSGDQLLSVYATEEGAKKECQRLFEQLLERRGNAYNPYFWEEQEVEP